MSTGGTHSANDSKSGPKSSKSVSGSVSMSNSICRSFTICVASASDVCGIRGARLTSKPASEIRNSISNLCWRAWCLIMATVRVGGVVGLEIISPGVWLGDEGVDIVFDEISC